MTRSARKPAPHIGPAPVRGGDPVLKLYAVRLEAARRHLAALLERETELMHSQLDLVRQRLSGAEDEAAFHARRRELSRDLDAIKADLAAARQMAVEAARLLAAHQAGMGSA